jgi:photosystem II stability/assembly factor-like uncharacterized protein
MGLAISPSTHLEFEGLFRSRQENFMPLHTIRVSLLALATALILAACGGGGDSTKPEPPVGGITIVEGDSQATLTWVETPGVEYWIFAAPNSPNLTLSNWLATSGSTYRLKVTSPYVVTGLTNGTPYSFFLTGRINKGPGSDATPTKTATPRLAGVTWETVASLSTASKTNLASVAYLDTSTNIYGYKYVGASTGGRLLTTSQIGGTWTAAVSNITTDINAVEYLISKFVALGAAGKIISSADSTSWTLSTNTNTENLNALTSNGTLMVAVGDNGTILTSTDASKWTAATSVPAGTPHLYSVSYSNKWIAVGANGTLLKSDDGQTWTTAVQTPATSNHLRAIATTSTNLNGVTTYTYLAVGDNGTIVRSINGTDWTVQSPSPTSANLNAVAGVNQFLAVGNSGVILTSTDGLIWTSQTLNPAVNLKTLLRADNQYIAVTDTGVIYTSK